MKPMFRSLMVLFALIAVTSVVAQAQSSLTQDQPRYQTKQPSPPAVLVHNESNQRITLYDGAWPIVSVMPGETAGNLLTGAGTRTLTIRSQAWVTQTEAYPFGTNRAYDITVGIDGKAYVQLRPVTRS